jgi:diadenosine tetraphosphate (Ap4A) HIT family hydrolase
MRYETEHKQKTWGRVLKVLKEAAKVIRRKGPHRIGVGGGDGQGRPHHGFHAHFRV